MSDSKLIGTYLGRPVHLVNIVGLPEVECRNAVVLFGTSGIGNFESVRSAIEPVFRNEPLAVSVCGEFAEDAFSFLLNLQSRSAGSLHTMTYSSTESLVDSLEEFLVSVLPASDRFDQWERYLVISSEAESLSPVLSSLEIGGFSRSIP